MIIRFSIKYILFCIISVFKLKNLRIAFAATVFLQYYVAKRDITLFEDADTFSV